MTDEVTNISDASINHHSGNGKQILYQEVLLKSDSNAMCTNLNSSDGSFIPILSSEEVVMYEDVEQKGVVQIDDCFHVHTDFDTCSQKSISLLESTSQNKNSRHGLHKCKVCAKSFSQAVNLITHERIHTGEKPFKCTFCMKPFSQQPNLVKHMKTHTGERPHQCSICKKCFTQKANLTKHIRVHTGEKPYPCQHCGKSFTQQVNLTKHVRLHTGERPFHCHFCSKTFVQQSNLERHERTHTCDKLLKCEICNHRFVFSDNLVKHVHRVHKDTVNPLHVQVTDHHKRELHTVKSYDIESKPDTMLDDRFEGNSSKKIGIQVLYCMRTRKILRRVH